MPQDYELLADVFPILREQAEIDDEIERLERLFGDNEQNDSVTTEHSTGDDEPRVTPKKIINIRDRNKAKSQQPMGTVHGAKKQPHRLWGGGYHLGSGDYVSGELMERVLMVSVVVLVVYTLIRARKPVYCVRDRVSELEGKIDMLQKLIWEIRHVQTQTPFSR